MTKGIFIVGTDTGVGKTVISAGLTYLLHQTGLRAGYFKPVLSGATSCNGKLIPGDTRFVKRFAGLLEEEHRLTPYMFQTPVSPHLAAKLEGRNIDFEVIASSFESLGEDYEYLVVEGAGGLCVPLTEQLDMQYELIKKLGLGVLVVSRAGLGTINHTLLTLSYAKTIGLNVRGVIINGYTGQKGLEDDNINIISSLSKLPIIGVVPRIEDLDVERLKFGSLKEVIEKGVNMEVLLSIIG